MKLDSARFFAENWAQAAKGRTQLKRRLNGMKKWKWVLGVGGATGQESNGGGDRVIKKQERGGWKRAGSPKNMEKI